VEGTVGDFTLEQVAWKPGGNANPVAGLLIHLISGEDLFLKMMTGQQPLAMGPYAGKTGASEPHPMGNYGEWAGRVSVDLPQALDYLRAVFKSTEEYVASLKPEELEREIDLTSAGLGKMTLGGFISMVAVIHPSNHIGEISCMKGQQGGKGYPF
jgi:uncharacterized damage-inducible protein DinB